MGDDRLAASHYSEFQNEFVARIGQCRSPEEVDLLLSPNLAEVIDQSGRIRAVQVQFLRVAQQNCLVLQRQRNRYGNLKLVVQ